MLNAERLNRLFRYAMSLTNHRDDAYDLLQTSVEKFLRRKQQSITDPSAYLRRMIRNQFIDQTRRHSRVAFELIEDQDALEYDTQSLEELVVNQDLVILIWQKLAAAEREVLYLWAIEGFTAKEIATEINVPRGTVLSRIHRIRKNIQQIAGQDKMFNGLGRGHST